MASHFAPKHERTKRSAGGSYASPSRSRYNVDYYTSSWKGSGRGRGDCHPGRVVPVVIASILAVVVIAGGAYGFMLYRSVMTVKDSAQEIMSQASGLKEALKSGEEGAISDTVYSIVTNTNTIESEVSSPLWTAATFLPVVGEDVKSVQTLGTVAHDLVYDALVPISDSLSGSGLSGLFQDGAVNVELVKSISSSVSEAAPVVRRSLETISALPEAHIPQIAEILDRVKDSSGQVEGLLDEIEPLLKVLPQMLGGDGQERTYLIIAQNNSELRSAGGLPGSWGELTVKDGVFSIGEFTTLVNEPGFDVEVTQEEHDHFGLTIGTNAAQLTMTPDFMRVGEIAQGYWKQAGYGTVDGVISIDPVFLQRLLTLTGGFVASDGETIDGTNAAQVLLSGTYWKFGNDGAAQDEYFGSIAGQAFQQIMGNLGNVGLTDLVETISQAGEDGRFLVWMDNEQEEQAMDELGLSGALGQDPTVPVLGVYFNDATVSKISWYASTHTEVGEGVRNEDGTTTYDVTTTLTNTISEEDAANAPEYVTGGAADKRDKSDMLDYVYFFAPAGGRISDFLVSDGGTVREGSAGVDTTIYGLQVKYIYVHARAGETVTFTYKVTVSAEATQPLSVRTTPLAQESLGQ